jgi:triacylglycerol lipase
MLYRMRCRGTRLAIAAAVVVLQGCVLPLNVPSNVAITGSTATTRIDFARLAEFARVAGNAYESNDVIEAAYGKANVIIRDLPGSDLRYFIVLDTSQRTQTISIRGTANKSNAWADIDSVKIYDARLGVFLHTGFKQASDQLYADARSFLHKDYTTRITGHSLGGAVACILMMNLIHDGYPVDQVLTFGQPKVTNARGGAGFTNAPYYRIINDQDIVAQLPPSSLVYDLSGPYEHFGPELTLQADRKWSYSPVHVPRDFLTGANWRQLDLESGTDHQIKNYIDRLQALK